MTALAVTLFALRNLFLVGRNARFARGSAERAADVILDVVDRAQAGLCRVAMVRMDAGFPSAALLAGLEARVNDYVAPAASQPGSRQSGCTLHKAAQRSSARPATHLDPRLPVSGREL